MFQRLQQGAGRGDRHGSSGVAHRLHQLSLADPELAARLKAIYSAGDTRDPMELYGAFRGREAAIAALLQQRGLAEAQSG